MAVKHWKAEFWLKDTADEDGLFFDKDDVRVVLEKARRAINAEYEGFVVEDYDFWEDKEEEQ
jgi:hypothetical protein